MLPERFHRLKAALERRQPDLTVLLENVHKTHNFSAVLRSCDAAGVFEAHGVYPDGVLPTHHLASAGSRRWVGVRSHPDLATALGELAGGGVRLVAAHPADDAVDYREVDYTVPTAILFGQEKEGLTERALAACAAAVRIPMMGLGRSLNVSVAAALILFEARRQRERAGLYDAPRLAPELFDRTLFEWSHPRLARRCRERGEPYPRLGPDGELLDPLPIR